MRLLRTVVLRLGVIRVPMWLVLLAIYCATSALIWALSELIGA